MEPNRTRRGGFSLIELLIVIGLIASLIALLLPVISRARRMGRSTVCLAHLQQWGQSFQMYLNSNAGRPLPIPRDGVTPQWWEILTPYNGDVKGCLICPEATEPRAGTPDFGTHSYKHGTATCAWEVVTYDVGEPQWKVRGEYKGGYGMNQWTFSHKYTAPEAGFVKYPPAGAERIPLLGDCRQVATHPPDSDGTMPPNLQGIGPHWGGVSEYCLDRHGMAVNLVFLDGHAERVPLNELWHLKWSETFKPHNVVLPSE